MVEKGAPKTPSIDTNCLRCQKTVTAYTILSGEELWSAIDKNDEIRVMHIDSESGEDHRWYLGDDKKEKLRQDHAKGLI